MVLRSPLESVCLPSENQGYRYGSNRNSFDGVSPKVVLSKKLNR